MKNLKNKSPLLFISILLSLFVFSFSSCAKLKMLSSSEIKNETMDYSYTDSSGDFLLKREIGVLKKKNETYVKTQILSENGKEDESLEKSIVISSFDQFKTKNGKIKMLLPKISQYTVWFDGKKFFSQVRPDFEQKKIEVVLTSPEKKWQGKSLIELTAFEGVYCFFSQVAECAEITDFLKLSREKKAGKMSFRLIWDKYPYIQEQYKNLPVEVFSDATLAFDGQTKEGDSKFVLRVAGHSIFYHFDKDYKLIKIFWVAQGISQTILQKSAQ